MDLSWPRGASVNAGIRKGFYEGRPCTYTLPNIMDAADRVAALGPGAYMWAADLARAYRQLRTCPLSTPLLGIHIDGKYYTDTAPPFGCRTSSMACARTTNAVVYIMRKRGHFLHCYLDDFIGIAASHTEAERAYSDILDITTRLGLALAPGKCTPPAKELEWLGFKISATEMKLTIPQEKLDETLSECTTWMTKTTATRKEIQRLAGRLYHIAKCIEPARRFMNRIFAALRDTPFGGQHPISDGLKSDVKWFLAFAQKTNGLILLRTEPRQPWVIECDSSLRGGGAYSETHYYSAEYPEQMQKNIKNIAHLEAINLVVALKSLTPPEPEKYRIIINTDNAASQQVLESGAGKDDTLTACAREIWLHAATNSCEVEVRHKPGKELILADALSRCMFDKAAAIIAIDMCNNLKLNRKNITFLNALTEGM